LYREEIFARLLAQDTNYCSFNWNTTSQSWEYPYKYINSFDANGTLSGRTQLVRDLTTSSWQNDFYTIYSYDVLLNKTEEKIQSWNTSLTMWVDRVKINYSYDIYNNCVEKLEQNQYLPGGGPFTNYSRETYVYNSTNQRIESLYQLWDISLNSWKDDSKTNFTYDLNGNETESLTSKWNQSISAWENDLKVTSFYAVNNKKTQTVVYVWDSAGSWTSSYKTGYLYDASGNEIETIWQIWSAANTWINSSKLQVLYDMNGKPVEYLNFIWDDPGNFWQNYAWYFYSSDGDCFSTLATSINTMENKTKTTGIFPNPACSSFQLKNMEGTVEIYTVAGKLVLSEPNATEETAIDVSGLSKGIYFVKVKSGNMVFSSKLIVE
jgi:hypothetical protein